MLKKAASQGRPFFLGAQQLAGPPGFGASNLGQTHPLGDEAQSDPGEHHTVTGGLGLDNGARQGIDDVRDRITSLQPVSDLDLEHQNAGSRRLDRLRGCQRRGVAEGLRHLRSLAGDRTRRVR